ncbi:hypothetical protein A3Q56_06809 [Intoshia linei]|uniref:DDE-1 domain-containing protein n=1 Tax=Intoshia linei TaxID=1819745 RepID=A0A177AVL8_9BILA|nr:hypothetical protein A3Q56_06809 [Intoshia linei]
MKWEKDLKKQKRKICLFLDNFPGHKVVVQLSHIEIQMLPPNTTSKLQHLDGGIIRSFKTHFNSQKINEIYSKMQGQEVSNAFKSLNLKDAVVFIDLAWSSVLELTILNCFKAFGWEDSISTSTKNDSLIKLDNLETEYKNFLKEADILDSITFKKICHTDFDENNETLILNNVMSIEESSENEKVNLSLDFSKEKSDCVEETSEITYSDCLKMVEKINKYISQDNNFSID